jgi:hypothetical protein
MSNFHLYHGIVCHGEYQVHSTRFWWCPIWWLIWIFILLAHWNNSPRVNMSLHLDTLFWFQTNQRLLVLRKAVCLSEKQKIPFFCKSLGWPDRVSNPQSTTFEASILAITSPMWYVSSRTYVIKFVSQFGDIDQ